MRNSKLITKIRKNRIFKFFPIISSNSHNSASVAIFLISQLYAQVSNGIKCVRFLSNKIHQSKYGEIIHTNKI